MFGTDMYRGLLSPEEMDAVHGQGLLNLAGQLLAASGPSPTRNNLAQTLGHGLIGYQQTQQDALNSAVQNKLTASKLEEINKNRQQELQLKNLVGAPAKLVPNDAEGNELVNSGGTGYLGGKLTPDQFYAGIAGLGGDYSKLGISALSKRDPKSSNAPSNIREWEYYNGLDPKDQARYLNMKRQGYTVGNVNGVATMRPTIAGLPAIPLTTLSQEVNAQSALSGAKESAKTAGEAKAKTAFDIPRIEQNVNQAISDIDQLSKHPGLNYITGAYSKLPVIPGTRQASAHALANQVEGQTFLQAYNQLRGGGSITDVEGEKATKAIGRLNRSQSTEDYQSALKELKQVLNIGLERAKNQAGQSNQPIPATPAQPASGGSKFSHLWGGS